MTADPEYAQQRRKRWATDPEYRVRRLRQAADWRARNPQKVAAGRRADAAVRRARYRALRLEILAAYGDKCVCCGEDFEPFLGIDHEQGDGSQHRKVMGSSNGWGLYRFLKENGFPSGFRVLCHSCNLALYHYFGQDTEMLRAALTVHRSRTHA